MPIDPGAVGQEGEPVERGWTPKECMLYALGVGAGLDELEFATEKGQKVLPTFAVIAGRGGAPVRRAGTFDFARLVHGKQAFELHGAIPPEGRVVVTGRITGIWDKGSGAVIETESTARDVDSGAVRFATRSAAFIRGEGGFGGERGPSGRRNEPPERKPDVEVRYETRPEQALIYRLSGDFNPLHSDPEFARRAGFERPILHGLCTYGFTGRALLHALCGGEPGRFRSMEGRFSKPVYPGETLVVSIWVDGGVALFRTENQDGLVVLDEGRCTFEP
jgi:acyl dehydratase